MTPITKILVGFTASTDSVPLGTIWLLETANTDFYLKPVGGRSLVHLSAHGPNAQFSGHRFHVKIDQDVAERRAHCGQFVAHGIPDDGLVISGQQLAPDAFLVARLRWLGELQQPEFRAAAAHRDEPLPLLSFDGRSGRVLSAPLQPAQTADIDLVISYGQPFWPDAADSLRDSSRLGPLRNSSGMWLTATAYRRSQVASPSPEQLLPRLPASGETAKRLMCGGSRATAGDIYWFVDAITSTEALDSWPPGGQPPAGFYR
jgi:hypothetical protein